MRANVSIEIEEDEFELVLCHFFLDVCIRAHEWVWSIKKMSSNVCMDESCDMNEFMSQINESCHT